LLSSVFPHLQEHLAGRNNYYPDDADQALKREAAHGAASHSVYLKLTKEYILISFLL
jgi:hypothetical protein